MVVVYTASEEAEETLVQIHDRVVRALIRVDGRVGVQADDHVRAELLALLEERDVARVYARAPYHKVITNE